jgi:hypothetical protein
VLLRQLAEGDADEPLQQGGTLAIALGDQAEPGGSRHHRDAAPGKHTHPDALATQRVMSACNAQPPNT